MSMSRKPGVIAVLEDNVERRDAMRAALEDRFHQYQAVFFDATAEMIEYLKEQLARVILISLDHDLELKDTNGGPCIDPGCGRDLADFLAARPAGCPVVIHSTNTAAADGMKFALDEAGWRTYRVTPFGDLEWVPTLWLRTVRQAILDTAVAATKTA